MTGEAAGDEFGISVSGAGDVNGDGYADVIVGAWGNDAGGSGAGRAYVYYGAAFANSAADLIFTGEAASDFFSRFASGAGDLTGDGLADVIVGAYSNDEAGSSAGKAYVYDVYQYILRAPNGGETWPVGSQQTIRWMGKDLAIVSLSTDGGLTYEMLRDRAGGSAENEFTLRVPHAPTRFAMMKIEPVSTTVSGQDQSDSLFTIETSVSLLTFTVAARPGGGAELAWDTQPAVGPQGIAGYRLYRSDAGAAAGDLGRPIGPSLITANGYTDASGAQGATYRLAAVNGLGEELELGRRMLAPSAPLAAWPLPYRGGELNVSFAAAGGLGRGPGAAEVALFDAAGRRVRTLKSGEFMRGYHTTAWDGRDSDGHRVPSGVYFLNLRTEGQARQLKVVITP
jgi:hypothetical protein